MPGFFAIEQQLAEWLHQRFGTVVELFYAHGLRQGPDTLKSTGFDVHQDTEVRLESPHRRPLTSPPSSAPSVSRRLSSPSLPQPPPLRMTTSDDFIEYTPPSHSRLHLCPPQDYDFIAYTVVVKLTPDALDEPPSRVHAIGVPPDCLQLPSACHRIAQAHV